MRTFGGLAVTALLLGACGAAVPDTVPPLPPSALVQPAPVGTPVGAVGTSAVRLAAFMTMTLTDVRSGERFTFSDFKGKVTIVEGMAVW